MVGTEGREREDAAHGRDLDDVARALLAEDREDRLRDVENAEQVRLELVAQLLLGDLLDRSEEPVARVVDDDVDPPERLVRGLHRSEHLVAVGDVELDREDGVAVLLDQVTQSVCVAGGRCDLIATLEGGEDELAAKAFRRAGDEPNFAHDKPSCWYGRPPSSGRAIRIVLSSLCRWAAVAAHSSTVTGGPHRPDVSWPEGRAFATCLPRPWTHAPTRPRSPGAVGTPRVPTGRAPRRRTRAAAAPRRRRAGGSHRRHPRGRASGRRRPSRSATRAGCRRRPGGAR